MATNGKKRYLLGLMSEVRLPPMGKLDTLVSPSRRHKATTIPQGWEEKFFAFCVVLFDTHSDEQTEPFPCDIMLEVSEKLNLSERENKCEISKARHQHRRRPSLDSSVEKEENPLLLHQKFKHSTEFELHILQWNDLEFSLLIGKKKAKPSKREKEKKLKTHRETSTKTWVGKIAKIFHITRPPAAVLFLDGANCAHLKSILTQRDKAKKNFLSLSQFPSWMCCSVT